jgi:hypothetical protein
VIFLAPTFWEPEQPLIQDFGLDRFFQGLTYTGLYRILVYSGIGLDRFIQDFGLFRVWFRQVYTGFWFRQGYTGFWFRQVYTGFWFIQGLV